MIQSIEDQVAKIIFQADATLGDVTDMILPEKAKEFIGLKEVEHEKSKEKEGRFEPYTTGESGFKRVEKIMKEVTGSSSAAQQVASTSH